MSKQELVILGRKTGHHQTKYFEDRTNDEEPFRTVVVIQLAFTMLVTLPYHENSDSSPMIGPQKNMKKISSEEIHAIVLGAYSLSWLS